MPSQTVVAQSFGVDPTLEIELSRQLMSGDLVYAGADGWKCSEDGSCFILSEEDEKGDKPFALPSAKELLDNSWPLAVMWPVLYVFYQGELALGLEV